MGAAITPFRIAASDEQLADLKRRLLATRWPDKEPVSDWSQGMPLAYTQELCAYWATQYDWRAREAQLNRFSQFKTSIDGVDIHFIHVRSKHADALPLLITHGWPGSIAEFHKIIEPLSDPTAHGGEAADAFHVVCPALPGYGFSSKPTEPGWSVERIARAWATLMQRLGYARYVAQGGDWGSMVTTAIGLQDAGYCLVASAVRDMPNGKRRLVSVVLGTSSREARAAESQKLLNWGFQAWDAVRLFEAGKPIATVPVWKGKTPEAQLGASGALFVTVPKGEGDKLKTQIERTDPLVAPLTQGQQVGQIKVTTAAGTPVANVPLVVMQPVELAGLIGRAWDALRLWIK